MNKKSSSKSTIAVLAIIVFVIFGYMYYEGKQAPAQSGLETTSVQEDPGFAIMQLQAQVDQIKIEPKFFLSKSFQNLKDYSVDIPVQGVGRPNPFAQLPGYVPATTSRSR